MSKCVAEVLRWKKLQKSLASLASKGSVNELAVADPEPRRRQANPVAPDVVLRHASRRQQQSLCVMGFDVFFWVSTGAFTQTSSCTTQFKYPFHSIQLCFYANQLLQTLVFTARSLYINKHKTFYLLQASLGPHPLGHWAAEPFWFLGMDDQWCKS